MMKSSPLPSQMLGDPVLHRSQAELHPVPLGIDGGLGSGRLTTTHHAALLPIQGQGMAVMVVGIGPPCRTRAMPIAPVLTPGSAGSS